MAAPEPAPPGPHRLERDPEIPRYEARPFTEEQRSYRFGLELRIMSDASSHVFSSQPPHAESELFHLRTYVLVPAPRHAICEPLVDVGLSVRQL